MCIADSLSFPSCCETGTRVFFNYKCKYVIVVRTEGEKKKCDETKDGGRLKDLRMEFLFCSRFVLSAGALTLAQLVHWRIADLSTLAGEGFVAGMSIFGGVAFTNS